MILKKYNNKYKKQKNSQKDFNKYLKLIQKGRKVRNKKTLSNNNILFNGRNDAIKFVEYYGLMILETKRKETEGRWLEILTRKKMLQKLPIALALVRAGKNSENVLNETRQIVYSLYQSKEIIKKVYNNIIKSIQL